MKKYGTRKQVKDGLAEKLDKGNREEVYNGLARATSSGLTKKMFILDNGKLKTQKEINRNIEMKKCVSMCHKKTPVPYNIIKEDNIENFVLRDGEKSVIRDKKKQPIKQQLVKSSSSKCLKCSGYVYDGIYKIKCNPCSSEEENRFKKYLKKAGYNITGGEIQQLKQIYGDGIISDILSNFGLGYSAVGKGKMKGGDIFGDIFDKIKQVIPAVISLAPLIAKMV